MAEPTSSSNEKFPTALVVILGAAALLLILFRTGVLGKLGDLLGNVFKTVDNALNTAGNVLADLDPWNPKGKVSQTLGKVDPTKALPAVDPTKALNANSGVAPKLSAAAILPVAAPVVAAAALAKPVSQAATAVAKPVSTALTSASKSVSRAVSSIGKTFGF